MTTFDFTPLFRATVGFDRLMRQLQEQSQWSEGANSYPPYNIERTGEDQYRVTLAVAGFAEADLAVTVRDTTLTVEGQRKPEKETAYLHRGIAGRSFKRVFQLADHVRVVGAHLSNGLLIIDLVREVPEAMRPRRIAITTAAAEDAGEGTSKLIEAAKEAA